MAWFSNFYQQVQSKNCRRNSFLIFFQNFFRILSENFSDFRPKNFIKFSKLTSTSPEEQFVAWNFFLKFWIVLDFLQKPSACFSNFYLRVQSKNCGRNTFLIFLFRTFSDFEWKIFHTFGQKTSKSFQNYLLRVQRNNLWLDFFLKFWIVLDFLQKPLAWFSNVYLRVQSKNCGRKSFLIFLFRFFFGFWEENFPDFRPKNFIKFSKLPSTCPEEQFVASTFLKSFEPFWIFCRNLLAWFSNFYLQVQSKNCGRNSFLIFLFRIFSDFERKFFRLPTKNLQKVLKTNFYVSRGTVCGFNIFKKFWTVLDFLQKPFRLVLKFLSTSAE